ncbi:MAG TPA: hypothetical protein VHB02_19010 [Acidimicrobiales bacterium]|nr:hypothetical protein [Acidimicrobiales bacterium]
MPARFHLLRHGGTGPGDSLDLLAAERDALDRLLGEWSATRPGVHAPATAVVTKWDHGTLGKLLLERSAVWLAAREDVARALDRAGQEAAVGDLRGDAGELRSIVDRMDRASRGVQPISLAVSPEFDEAVSRLGQQVASGALRPAAVAEAGRAVGPFRADLRSASFVRRHAPTHPGRGRRRPLSERLHTALDRLRGLPWAESPLADRAIAQRYDQEQP